MSRFDSNPIQRYTYYCKRPNCRGEHKAINEKCPIDVQDTVRQFFGGRNAIDQREAERLCGLILDIEREIIA